MGRRFTDQELDMRSWCGLRFTLGMEHWGSFSRALGSQTEEGQVWHKAEPSEARGHVPGSPMSGSPSCSVLGQHTLLR